MGIECLQCAHGVAIIAVFRIVVVFDHRGIGTTQPCHERGTPFTREHGTTGVLMRRRDDDGINARTRQRVHAQAAVVHRNGHHVQPQSLDRLPGVDEAGILDPNARRAAGLEGTHEQHTSLRPAAGDEHA